MIRCSDFLTLGAAGINALLRLALTLVLAAGTAAYAADKTTAKSAGGPPVEDGWYVGKDVCPGEGCRLDWMLRVVQPTPFFNQENARRPGGTLRTGESLEPLRSNVRVRPARGVVRLGDSEVRKGDVVWLLWPEGEGYFTTWVRGKTISWAPPDDPDGVRWDEPMDHERRMEWWVEVKRSTGATVWLRNPRELECISAIAGDENCKPVPGKAARQ